MERLAALAADSPMDDFLHKHLLQRLLQLPLDEARELAASPAWAAPPLRALLATAAALSSAHADLDPTAGSSAPEDPNSPAWAGPLNFLRCLRQPDQVLHAAWSELFAANLLDHQPLPRLAECGLDRPCADGELETIRSRPILNIGQIEAVAAPACSGPPGSTTASADLTGSVTIPAAPPGFATASAGPTARETAEAALRALTTARVPMQREMRHQASLAPVGLLRPWQARWKVRDGRLDYEVVGMQTVFGRGMDLDQARASYLMEMVERVSALPTVRGERVLGLSGPDRLLLARPSELPGAVPPDALGLEAPWGDKPLRWIEAEDADGGQSHLPAQAVFLFANFDEPSMFSGLGSTGLASGNTRAEARLSGLLEVLERDAEIVTPFDFRGCFRVTAADERIARLLADYRERGVDLLFQDLSQAAGLPCYKAFVVGPEGQVAKGAAAHPDARRALVSAMTEVPYPYPGSPASRRGPGDLPLRSFEELPNHSLGDAEADLRRIEALLRRQGLAPRYVDLTRDDLGLPVARAFVPGLAPVADFDQFTRIPARLFSNYLETND